MRSVISGLVGGVISVLIGLYIAKRVGRDTANGELRFGRVMWVIGIACAFMALLPVAITIAGNHRDFLAKVGLFVGFGVGAIYCFGEAAFVRGTFDDEGIVFSTPWTGMKREKWSELVSIEENDWAGWFTLTFRSGSRIRLSRYLSGHQSVLDTINERSAL